MEEMMVSSLLTADGKGKANLIAQLFSTQSAAHILRTPVLSRGEDKLQWRLDLKAQSNQGLYALMCNKMQVGSSSVADKDLSIFAAVAFNVIWMLRNRVCFKGDKFCIEQAIGMIQNLTDLWNDNLNEAKSLHNMDHEALTTIVTFDAAVTGIGSYIDAVLRDGWKNLIGAYMVGISTTVQFVAESTACLEAVKLALGIEFSRIVIMGDSKVILDALTKVDNPPWRTEPLICQIQDLCETMSSVSFAFISRRKNTVAHG
ncbi:hypothetical protein Ancab_004676, partial [Ancistrocladus abbreviatus]